MVIIGFGKYKGYKLQEVPTDFLSQLATSYPLAHSSHSGSSEPMLRATIAVHEEVQRRTRGGEISRRQMPWKEMASKLVNAGFRQMSRQLHPDMPGGELEAQKALGQIRDRLVEMCREIEEPETPDAFLIPDPDMPYGLEITDDDIPF